MKQTIRFFFGADLWKSRAGVMALTSFLSLMWFVVDWCAGTTFRAMSDWLLYADNIALALIITLPFLLSRRIWVQVVVLVIVDLFLEANLMYSRTYFTAIPPESFALEGNLSDFTGSVRDSLRLMDLGFIAILAAGAFAASRMPVAVPRSMVLRMMLLAAVLVLVSAVRIIAKGGFYKEYDKLVQSCYYSTCGVPIYTLLGHHVYCSLDRAEASSPQALAEIDNWLEEQGRLMPWYSLPDIVERRRNLVVILCESLESWPIEAEIDGKEITPYINSLISDSTTLYAPNMLTQVASGRSIDCQLLLKAGMLPMVGSVYSMKYPSVEYPTLIKAMREKHGGRSVIFTCDKPITWNQEAISRAFGYDSLIDRRAWDIDELVGNPGKLSDGSFLRQSVEKLREGSIWPVDSTAFLTFVTYSGHSPFELPDKMKDPAFDISSAGLHGKLEDYVTMAHYTDSQLHTIVDYLKSRPDFDETLVLITGDHEGLATWRDEIRASSSVARDLVSEGQYTPFILLNSPVGGRVDEVMGQIDMYPTLLDLLGLGNYYWKGLGQNILSPSRVPVAISSMTGEVAGDIASISNDTFRHLQKARKVSDAIIRQDYFRR